jgi:hypothetical protein
MKWYVSPKYLKVLGQKTPDPTFAPGEDPSKFGTPAVDILGEHSLVIDIPGVQGGINLQVSVDQVKKALERSFGPSFFAPITTIKVTNIPGRFGEVISQEPHTIYLNEDAMVSAVQEAVTREIQQYESSGQKVEFTPEIGKKINAEVAKLLWETLPHERQHAVDFQESIKRMMETGSGGPETVGESPGEKAGKDALSRFDWYEA